jgi:hypothetical protein
MRTICVLANIDSAARTLYKGLHAKKSKKYKKKGQSTGSSVKTEEARRSEKGGRRNAHPSRGLGFIPVHGAEQAAQLRLERAVFGALVKLAHKVAAGSERVEAELQRCHTEILQEYRGLGRETEAKKSFVDKNVDS